MADISQISDGTTTWDIKDATARSSIANAITTAGTGLSKSGNTLNHSNSVTAGTIGQSANTIGPSSDIPYATYDAQGHITGKGTYTHTSWTNRTPWLIGDGFLTDQKVIYSWPYINVLNDGFWKLVARGATVSLAIDGGTPITSGMATLFDGSYDSAITTVSAGSTAVLTIDFSTMSSGWFPEVGTYPYGDIYISFYYRCGAANLTARGYTDYNNIGWKDITVTELYTSDTVDAYRGTKWLLNNPGLYHLKTLEITYTGKASGTTPAGSSMTTIELNLLRSTTQMIPYVSKYSAQTLYDRLTAPQFRGVFEGNSNWNGTCGTAAGTAAKEVSCPKFVLERGARISVYCSTANTVNGQITLNVNNTGAKVVRVRNVNTASAQALRWEATDTLEFVFDSTYWNYLGSTSMMLTDKARTNANTNLTYTNGYFRIFKVDSSTTTGKPMHNGIVYETCSRDEPSWASQLYFPTYQTSGRYPQWRATTASNTWGTWNTFYTTANPPAFSNITGTATSAQLPAATSSNIGAVKPDGQSIVVANDGTLTATPAAVGMTCTERSGGVSLDTYDLETNSGSWPADGGWGWREEVWNDGRMTLYWWKWFATTGSGWQQLWTNLPYPTDATSFVDTPNPQVSLFDNAVSVQGAAMIKPTSLRTSSNTTGFKMTYYNSAANTNAKTLVLFRADGHWWKEGGSDPDDPTPAEQWAVGDAISIGGNSYYPVTEWKVSDSGAGGDSRLKAAVRFLITTSSTSGAWHVYAQYTAWTDSGYVPTSSQNGYMLIRKLNSQITTYTNDAGVKAKGDVWSALNTNQRQGYVSNGVVEGHLIWGDTPYIITDCGTFTNGQTVSSKTFYVGTTEVSGGVYTQTSVSDTTTTPTSN